MDGKRVFRKTRRSKPPSHHPLLALDIENDPKTGKFINAAVYGEITKKKDGKRYPKHIEEFFTNQESFLSFLEGLRPQGMRELPTKIILFNASYDYWFLMKITADNDLLANEGNIISGKLRNGIPIMDLTNLTRKGSLGDWIKYLDMNKQGIYKESLTDLEKRVKSDAKATWILGDYLETFFTKELEIPLKLTIASAARYLFSLRFFKDYWIRTEKQFWISDYERKAYRGGRTECFIGGKEDIYSYDVNSMYLSVMQTELFPDPNSAQYANEPKKIPEGLYIADVTLSVPEQYIGVLPIKDPNTGKLIFPTGTFRGHFASPELNYAIKECGVKIIKIHSCIKYKGKHYFRDYANFIWKKRKEYKDKGNKGMDILIKYLGNTLYGGFGQRNKDTFFGKLKDLELKEGIPINPNITTIDRVKYVTYTSSEGEDSSHTFPCIPVFIISYARLLLLKAMRANGLILIYTDTDSIKSRKKVIGVLIGDGLGEWGFEGYEKNVVFYKPKMYGDKCKGVPKRANKRINVTEKNGCVWEDTDRKIYTYEKPNKMRESFRRDMMPALWKSVIKEVSKKDDKREWLTEKSSMPLKVSTLENV